MSRSRSAQAWRIGWKTSRSMAQTIPRKMNTSRISVGRLMVRGPSTIYLRLDEEDEQSEHEGDNRVGLNEPDADEHPGSQDAAGFGLASKAGNELGRHEAVA